MSRLSEDICKKLQNLPDNETFQQNYQKLIKSVFINLIGEAPDYQIIIQLQSINEDNQQFQQEIIYCFNVLMLGTTEVIRKNYVEEELRFQLQELEFQQEFIQQYLKAYGQFQEILQDKDNEQSKQNFEGAGEHVQLRDVEWKQDFIVANRNISQINQDQYYINFQCQSQQDSQNSNNNNNTNKQIQFRCNYEQLTDLAYQVNVALQSIKATDVIQI